MWQDSTKKGKKVNFKLMKCTCNSTPNFDRGGHAVHQDDCGLWKPWYIEEFLNSEKKLIIIEDDGLEVENGELKVKINVNTDKILPFLTSVAQKEREVGRLEGINSVINEIKPGYIYKRDIEKIKQEKLYGK